MHIDKFIGLAEHPPMADTSALAAINRALLVRQASFGAGEIASEAIWIDANRSNELWRTTTDGRMSSLMGIIVPQMRRRSNGTQRSAQSGTLVAARGYLPGLPAQLQGR